MGSSELGLGGFWESQASMLGMPLTVRGKTGEFPGREPHLPRPTAWTANICGSCCTSHRLQPLDVFSAPPCWTATPPLKPQLSHPENGSEDCAGFSEGSFKLSISPSNALQWPSSAILPSPQISSSWIELTLSRSGANYFVFKTIPSQS